MTIFSFVSPLFQSGFILDFAYPGAREIGTIIGLLLGAAFIGFWFGNIVAQRARAVSTCSCHNWCHNKFRTALMKHAGISLALTLMVGLGGCAR